MAQFSALSLAAVSVASLAAAGGGVSFAAIDAQPGDLLYPVRVSIYSGASAETQARIELDAAEELLRHRSELDAQGNLSAEILTDISADYDTHLNAVRMMVTEAEAQGDAAESTVIRAMLESHIHGVASAFAEFSQGSSASQNFNSHDMDGSVRADAHTSTNASTGYDAEAHQSESAIRNSVGGNVQINVDADAESTVRID